MRRRKRLDSAHPAVAIRHPSPKKSTATADKMVSSERLKPWPKLQAGSRREVGVQLVEVVAGGQQPLR